MGRGGQMVSRAVSGIRREQTRSGSRETKAKRTEKREDPSLGGPGRGRMGKGHAGTYPAAGRGRREGREMRALARGSGTRAQPMRSVEPTRWEGGDGAPGRGCASRPGGGAGRDGKWDDELGPGEEARGGVGAESWRRPDRDRFLPERRPALDRGAGGGRPRAGRVTGKYRGRASSRLAVAVLVAPPPGQSGARRRRGGERGRGFGKEGGGGTRRASDRVAA